MARARGASVPPALHKRGRPAAATPRHPDEPAAVAVTAETLARWRRDPVAFITEALRHPDTGERIQLFPKQEAWFRACFTPNADGTLPAQECFLLTLKKSGKS